ncbi:hypothetical protein GCM10010172_38330 [Paractinoplanes ferrugineus]|uniref:Uncharacterized protein n=1 Tax=Paractinoplanes ferrugineus TaxID=113564 RepID=A0A919IUX6_9ACTN|nr:hypothetical protein [Actinoplanes ferrugineus]GIE09430.1 hypothetical protein Afe05nite_12700 [Actinoplanes ferrugineus]
MGRSWKYIAAWLSVTITAVTVTWFGVRLGVAPTLTGDPPVAIDANRRYTELRFGAAEPTVAGTTTSPTPAVSASRAKPSPTRTKTPAARPATSAAAPPASATPSPSPTADRRPRYRVPADGGSIVVAYSSTRVDVISADPDPGYVAGATRRSETIVVVRLATFGHTSVITAYWNGGPAAQVMEDYG